MHGIPLLVVSFLITLAVSSAASADEAVDALAGRYGSHFRNGNVQGDTYWSDDVVEIVPVGGNAAYVRVELNFYNGHMCSISGIGTEDGGRIVYDNRAGASPGDPPCVLTVSRRGGDLLVDDGGGRCKTYCGSAAP